MTILILVSQNERSWFSLKEKILAHSGVRNFLLCPINSDLEETTAEIESFIRSETSAECSIIPFSRRLLEHSLKVKDDYIKYISVLGGREVSKGVDLKEYFRYPGSDFSVWWLSLIYEKSPGKTDTFLHFVKLSLTVHLVQEYSCGELWMSCGGQNAKYFESLSGVQEFKLSAIGPNPQGSSGWLRDGLIFARESLRVLRYFFFLLGVRIRLRNKRPSIPAGCKRFLITIFPFFDSQKFADRKFYSKAYGPLQDGLEADTQPFVWLAMHTKIEPYTWKDRLRMAARVKEFDKKFFSVDEWITFGDILRIDLDFLRFFWRFLGVFKRLPSMTSWTVGNGCRVNLWPILRQDFISSFAGKVAVVNWHYLRIFLNIVRDLPENSTVVHFAEMHNWERCLHMACGAKGGVKTIALQHAHVPQLLINYFDCPDDLKNENFMKSVPQPRFLGSVGMVIQDYFRKQGWSDEKLFIVGGFRFQSLLNSYGHSIAPGNTLPVLVAAFSICYKENLEMLKMLHKAFNDGATGLKIIVKSHPAESVEKMAARENMTLNMKVFEFTETPLEKIVPDSCAMFACSTSSIFYAMACRKPVIVPYLYDAVDLCPLTNLYPYETRIESVQQLKDKVVEIIEGKYDQSRHEKLWNSLRQDYLNLDHDSSQCYKNLDNYLRI